MKDKELQINEILKEMRAIIAEQAQEIAVLRATITAIDEEKSNKVE